jgi:hypothetical protein
MRHVITLLALLLLSSGALAADVAALLGVVPGEKSKWRGKSFGGPFEIIRLPTADSRIRAIFLDEEVMIVRGSEKVVGVGAERAYSTELECTSAESTIRALLSDAFPSKYKGEDFRWQYQSADGEITAGAVCMKISPFPVLKLDVTHTKTNEEILRYFK